MINTRGKFRNVSLSTVSKVLKGLRAVFTGEELVYDVDVLVENGRVLKVGKNLDGDEVINLEGKVVYPAFVDSHTHLLYCGDRLKEFSLRMEGLSYVEILKEGGGIYETVRKTVNASDEEILNQTRERIEKLKNYGVGVIEIKTGYGIGFDEEIRQLRIINRLSEEFKDVDIIPTLLFHVKPKDRDFEDYIGEFFSRYDEYKDMLRFVDVFADEGAFNYEETEVILKFFTDKGVKCRLHADEFKPFGSELAGKYKCISADHLLNPSDKGLELMAKNKVIATLCPITGFFLRKGFAPYEKIKSYNIEVALASDHNPGTSPFLNPFLVIILAVFSYGMKPTEAFRSYTYIASKSLRLKDMGKIDVGYKARFFAIDFTPDELVYWGEVSPRVVYLNLS